MIINACAHIGAEYSNVIGFEKRGNFAHKYFFQYSLLNVCDSYIHFVKFKRP